MELTIIHAVTGVTQDFIDFETEILRRYAHPTTRYEIRTIQEGAASIESHYDEYIGAIDTFRLVREAQEGGSDGVIITCFANANVSPAREIVAIPVIGSGMASMMLASLLGHHFALITTAHSTVHRYYEEASKLGILGKLLAVERCEASVLDSNFELPSAEEKARRIQSFTSAAKRAIEDGADVIVPACFGMIGVAAEIQDELGVPVVDPAGAAITVMEALVRTNLSHSKKAYPFPTSKERNM